MSKKTQKILVETTSPKNKDIKLLRYELQEEKNKHMLTKNDAADYLALKQKVVEQVDERL